MATRITVEWMTHVPIDEETQSSDYDRADWAFKQFRANELEKARRFAHAEAQRNPYGQTWLSIERADCDNPREWQWERDFNADEIYERD